MSNELEIKVGEFNDCRTVEPDQNGYYLVFSDYCYASIPLKKRLSVSVWSFVVGHGWNCHVRDDGTVSDEHRIEIDHPAYWAPLSVIEKSKSEIEKSKSEIIPDYRDGWRLKEGEQ